jgi:hypothetical protein
MARVAILAAIIVIAAACAAAPATGARSPGPSPSAGPSTGSGESTPALRCAEAIDADATLPDSYANLLGAVGLPTADSDRLALQTSYDSGEPPLNFFAKAGLLVRGGVAFTIEVSEPPSSALIGWGSPAEFGSTVSSAGCPGDGWLGFAGGFLVDQPHCVRLVIEALGGEEQVEVGVGAPCEGQSPPPEPSDP